MNPISINFKGKTAIVTGATKGIGLAIAQKLASHGANIVVAARTAAECDKTAIELKSMGIDTLACPTDVSKLEDIKNLYAKTIEKFGKLDIVISNSGVGYMSPAESLSEEQFDSTFDVNVKGAYYMSALAAKQYMAQETSGVIVIISSNSYRSQPLMMAAYATSKAAVVHLVQCLAKEWGKHKIRINSVAPGTVATEMASVYLKDPAVAERIKQSIPLKKITEAEDIANMVAFLASDSASMVTGQDVTVDGGQTL